MSLERDDENGLEFPWLLLALPGAVVLRKVATATQSAPMPPLVQPQPVRLQSATTAPGLEPSVPQRPFALQPLPSGFVREDVTPPPQPPPAPMSLPEMRVEAAVREVASAAVAQHAAKQASARFEARTQDLQIKTPAAAQAAVESAAKQLQADVARAPAAQNIARVERGVRDEVRKLEKAGIAPAEIERRAKKKATEMRKDAGRRVQKAVAPVQKAIKKLPAPVRRAGAAALAPVRREAERVVKQATAPIRREATRAAETLLAPVRQAATQAGRQLGVDQATQAFRDFGKKMGIPNIPVVLPTDLTPAGIRDAAYNTGRKMAQEQFAKATGLPLPLPPAISVKAIKKWADDLVPDDARQAIEMAVDIGLSATTSAVSAILAGAIGGSVIPGLGTVIGIGVALGVAALKGVVKEALTEKHAFQRLCEADDKLYQQYVKQASGKAAGLQLPKLSPLQYVPWLAQKSFDASRAVAEEQRKTKCGRTPYMTTLRRIGENVFGSAKATVPILGLQQLDQLIPLYEHAPKQEYFWDTGTIKRGGRIVGGTGKVLFGPSAAGHDVTTLLKLMKARRAQLQALVTQASRVESLAPNAIPPLRFSLVAEIRNATLMYQLDGSKLTEAWLKMLMGFLARLVRTEAAAAGAMRSGYEYQRKREAELQKQGKTGVIKGII
jgi:hypothetical protein